MAVMQQPIEDRRGQRLVTGQDLLPVLDALVGRDRDAAPLVAVAHQAIEEARLLPAHRLEAHLVDDQEARVEVLLSPQTGAAQVRVPPERAQQILQPQELRSKALLDAFTPRATGRCVLPTPGGPWISSVRFSRTHWQVVRVSMRLRSTEG